MAEPFSADGVVSLIMELLSTMPKAKPRFTWYIKYGVRMPYITDKFKILTWHLVVRNELLNGCIAPRSSSRRARTGTCVQ